MDTLNTHAVKIFNKLYHIIPVTLLAIWVALPSMKWNLLFTSQDRWDADGSKRGMIRNSLPLLFTRSQPHVSKPVTFSRPYFHTTHNRHHLRELCLKSIDSQPTTHSPATQRQPLAICGWTDGETVISASTGCSHKDTVCAKRMESFDWKQPGSATAAKRNRSWWWYFMLNRFSLLVTMRPKLLLNEHSTLPLLRVSEQGCMIWINY